jgi:hypothetical protein
MRGVTGLVLLSAIFAANSAAKPRFVFEERAGRSYTAGEARWRDALLRASVGGCKERLPSGSRLRPGIRDCVVNQVHVTNLSAHSLECRVILEFPVPDDDGRRRIEHTIHIAAGKERWLATAYGPSSLEPTSFESSCVVTTPERRS